MTKDSGCRACRAGTKLDFDFTMAFQPILDLADGSVWAYEALVRGPNGEPAYTILDRVTDDTRYQFDQAARVKAIELAGTLFPRDSATRLSINFMPNAVYEPNACIRASLEAARRIDFAHRRIMFEFTEQERFRDLEHVKGIVAAYRKQGFLTALDDFGAGFAGLSLRQAIAILMASSKSLRQIMSRCFLPECRHRAIWVQIMQVNLTLCMAVWQSVTRFYFTPFFWMA